MLYDGNRINIILCKKNIICLVWTNDQCFVQVSKWNGIGASVASWWLGSFSSLSCQHQVFLHRTPLIPSGLFPISLSLSLSSLNFWLCFLLDDYRVCERETLEEMRHFCCLHAPPTLWWLWFQDLWPHWWFPTSWLLLPSWWVGHFVFLGYGDIYGFICLLCLKVSVAYRGSWSLITNFWWMAGGHFSCWEVHHLWGGIWQAWQWVGSIFSIWLWIWILSKSRGECYV